MYFEILQCTDQSRMYIYKSRKYFAPKWYCGIVMGNSYMINNRVTQILDKLIMY